VGSGLLTSVVTGTIAAGGHVTQTGNGVVVVDVVAVVVDVGGGKKFHTEVTVQSTVNTPAEGPRNVTTLVVGQEKP
jgi:hypothetical protein